MNMQSYVDQGDHTSTTTSISDVTTFGGTSIPPGSQTPSRDVQVSGYGLSGMTIELLDNNALLRRVLVNSSGGFIERIEGLSVGYHSLTVREHASAPISPPWNFEVTQASSELIVDTSDLYLGGRNYYPVPSLTWTRKAYYPGSTGLRSVSGGHAPYRFISSAPHIATVDGAGNVTSTGNGTAIITVTDSSSPAQSKSFTVRASNVYEFLFNPNLLTAVEAINWAISVGGGQPVYQDVIDRTYVGPSGRVYWTGEEQKTNQESSQEQNQQPRFRIGIAFSYEASLSRWRFIAQGDDNSLRYPAVSLKLK
ncbi:hypothetical protein AB7M22_001515 [Pseudomonas sp. ADAK2 TE3594]